jgi:hypothetical protein
LPPAQLGRPDGDIEREFPFITIDIHELKCLLDAIKIVSFRKIIVATSSSQASRRRLQAALQPAEGLLPWLWFYLL